MKKICYNIIHTNKYKMDTWMINDILSYIDIDTQLVLNNVSKLFSIDADILTY